MLCAFVSLSAEPRPPDGWLFNGTLDQIKADARRAAEIGVAHILFETRFAPGMRLPRMLEQLERLREAA